MGRNSPIKSPIGLALCHPRSSCLAACPHLMPSVTTRLADMRFHLTGETGKQTAGVRHDERLCGWCGGWQNCPMESDLGSTGRHGEFSLVPAERVGSGGPKRGPGMLLSCCRVRPAFRTSRHELINPHQGKGARNHVPGHDRGCSRPPAQSI